MFLCIHQYDVCIHYMKVFEQSILQSLMYETIVHNNMKTYYIDTY